MDNVVTEIKFPRFTSLFITGQLSELDKQRINDIRRTMSYDEYAGYSPNEQAKRIKIESILSKKYKIAFVNSF